MDSAVAPDTDGQLRFPSLGIFLLYAVAGCLLLTFPILGTGLASVDPDVLRQVGSHGLTLTLNASGW